MRFIRRSWTRCSTSSRRLRPAFEYSAPQIPLAANLTGQLMTEAPTAAYWRDHLRNAVQFAAGMARIAEAKPAIIIEIGPSASLLGMGRRCEPKLEAAWLPSLREGQEDWSVIAGSVAEFYVRGGRIDWRGWDRPWHRHRLLLPNYPFQRTRHWFDVDMTRRVPTPGESSFTGGGSTGTKSAHPLLGRPLATVWTNKLFEARLSPRSPAYLIDHQVQGSVVTPAAAYIEQALPRRLSFSAQACMASPTSRFRKPCSCPRAGDAACNSRPHRNPAASRCSKPIAEPTTKPGLPLLGTCTRQVRSCMNRSSTPRLPAKFSTCPQPATAL